MSGQRPILVAGVDYGSDSVRVAVVDAASGEGVLTVSRSYPRWATGAYCDPLEHRFRQHPLDHLETLEACFEEIADRLGDEAVAAIAIDATGSTPAPVDRNGVPLALHPEFADDPDAMFWLWKDRTSATEAEEVDRALREAEPDHTSYQGVYSSEWWWAKMLRAVRTNGRILEHAHSWVEHADWLPNLLTGADVVERFARNACSAGHKALYNTRLGGMVPRAVLVAVHPHLAAVADTFATPPLPAGTRVGTLSEEWAARLRLSTSTVVGMGSLDAHAGGVGAGIDDRSMVTVMGTSTVDLFLTDDETISGRDLRRLCGIAEDSIIPGRLGGETSQAAFGDLFAWYARVLLWPIRAVLAPELRAVLPEDQVAEIMERTADRLLGELEQHLVERQPTTIVAHDWINGRRYPDVDEDASAALLGLRIGHDAVDVYRALVEAAVLGTKAIVDGLAANGLRFERVILVGGIARKSPFICQSMADALGVDVLVSEEREASATGAAMYAATAAGCFEALPAAQQALGRGFVARYAPMPAGVAHFDTAFSRYRAAGRILAGGIDPVDAAEIVKGR
ncbi:ribulokinase [Plantibacter sp. Leaf314]|uniref:ribulokinase n=1 Tax=Plantibacter sp. Leaf314 TaxID=1736333 RepID=UPI0006F5DC08|nr:ribulokinase [Plantibacter sp. Leaf314]KQQ49429.1 hypothetical protein ASF68_16160 [Plantibacter sp. Leaf314]